MKKQLLVLFLVMVLIVSLFGCGGGSGTQNTTGNNSTTTADSDNNETENGDDAQEEITLKVSLWDYSNTAYYKNMFDKVEETLNYINVEPVESSAAEYDDLIQVKLSAKEDLDVVFTKGTPALSALIGKNHVMALDEYMDHDAEFLKDKYSGLIEQLVLNDNTYGVPFRKDNNMIFYNKDIFDAAGVDYPEDGMTMEEYYELAKKLTSGEGAEKIYGAHVHTWPSNVSQFARRVETYDPWGADKFVLEPYYDVILRMQEEGLVQDFGSLKASNTHYSGVFYNEQAAMLQMGTWFINMLYENVEFNWGVCSLPNVEGIGNEKAIGGVTPISIGSYAKHPEQAWDFIKYVTGEEGAIILAENGILPGYSSDAINEIFDAFHDEKPNMPEGLSKYIDIDTYVIEQPMHEKGREADKIIGEEHDLIMTKSVSIEKGLQDMQDRANEMLGQ